MRGDTRVFVQRTGKKKKFPKFVSFKRGKERSLVRLNFGERERRKKEREGNRKKESEKNVLRTNLVKTEKRRSEEDQSKIERKNLTKKRKRKAEKKNSPRRKKRKE